MLELNWENPQQPQPIISEKDIVLILKEPVKNRNKVFKTGADYDAFVAVAFESVPGLTLVSMDGTYSLKPCVSGFTLEDLKNTFGVDIIWIPYAEQTTQVQVGVKLNTDILSHGIYTAQAKPSDRLTAGDLLVVGNPNFKDSGELDFTTLTTVMTSLYLVCDIQGVLALVEIKPYKSKPYCWTGKTRYAADFKDFPIKSLPQEFSNTVTWINLTRVEVIVNVKEEI